MSILGWIGNVFYVVGVCSIARKRPVLSQVNNLLGGAFYSAHGFVNSDIPLAVLSVFLTIVNGYGIWNWTRNTSPPTKYRRVRQGLV